MKIVFELLDDGKPAYRSTHKSLDTAVKAATRHVQTCDATGLTLSAESCIFDAGEDIKTQLDLLHEWDRHYWCKFGGHDQARELAIRKRAIREVGTALAMHQFPLRLEVLCVYSYSDDAAIVQVEALDTFGRADMGWMYGPYSFDELMEELPRLRKFLRHYKTQRFYTIQIHEPFEFIQDEFDERSINLPNVLPSPVKWGELHPGMRKLCLEAKENGLNATCVGVEQDFLAMEF